MIVKRCPVKGQARPFLPAKGEYEAVKARNDGCWAVPGDHPELAGMRLHEVPGCSWGAVAVHRRGSRGAHRPGDPGGGVAVLGHLAGNVAGAHGQPPRGGSRDCLAATGRSLGCGAGDRNPDVHSSWVGGQNPGPSRGGRQAARGRGLRRRRHSGRSPSLAPPQLHPTRAPLHL